ncbi:MAG TPA: CAP domain-containing protein [Fimbriimonadaceae bacterium]|nr:CAP domain-containing protein [Fimbriimonadaceae bacterium]
MRSIFSAAVFAFAVSAQADISAIYGKYNPTGSVATATPLVTWKLTPTGGGHVSRVEMSLNGRSVEAEFNSKSSSVEYRPAKPLRGGLYTVECRVTIERELIVRQNWSFEVSGGADDAGPATTFAANYALDETNEIRTELGLPAYIYDPRMSAAANAHSKYQILNGQTCHMEEPDKPGFTGRAPWDRIQHFGFPGTCYEGACGNQMDPRKAVRLLFDAPYHRIAFLQPGSPQIGIGFQAGALTVDYAVSDQEGVGLSPAAGQTGIPLAWDGNESPTPLRIYHASGPVGYPIVFSWFSPSLEGIRIGSMRLFGPDGTEIPCYVNTPANDDELRFAGVLTPKSKLQPKTTYTAEVHATTQRGQRIDRSWSFTTG